MTKLPKCTQEVIETLRGLGIKFNIITKVDHRFELFYEYERFDGRQCVHFVAELDGYGNITDAGPYFPDKPKREKAFCLNADGQKV